MNKRTVFMITGMFVVTAVLFGCDRPQSSSLNNRMKVISTPSPVEQGDQDGSEKSIGENDPNNPLEGVYDPGFDAFLDSKSDNITPTTIPKKGSKDFGTPDATGRVGYHYDIEKDKKNYDGQVDITVGDKLYSTQINDWYTNYDKYEGKIIEIEGYYIAEYAPYTFVGRYGPSCPYCNGGYVSFEFYTNEDLSSLKSLKDWIKVTGILRSGEDSNGVFYYIEVLKLEKMEQVGKDTVTN